MHLLNDETMQALCWTLVHSLWQGLLIAIAGGIVMILTKKAASGLRYNLLATLFFVFMAAACFTFNRELHLVGANTKTEVADLPFISAQSSNEPFQPANGTLQVAPEKNFIQIFEGYFDQHASLVVAIWFIILSAHSIRLLANIGYTQRIKHFKTHAPSPYWQDKLLELAERIQIKKQVALLESEIVKIPMMAGFLKPVILFPFSLMSQLPAEQVEAVLLHELAHIKRKDYLVNLLQSFAEIFFFFNPGVLWISSLIRDERENCCDDIALKETKNKKEFIHALVSFQEYNMDSSKYSLAFPGRKNHLLNRVKRIITNNNKTLDNMEKISLATGIVVIGLITIAFKQTVKQNTAKTEPTANVFQAKKLINDTVPDKPETTAFSFNGSIDGKKYRIKEINGNVVELYVEGKKIPGDKIGDYRAIIDKLHLDAKKLQDELQAQNALLEKQRAEMIEQEERMNKEKVELEELREKANDNEAISKFNAEQEALNSKMEEFKKEQEEIIRKQSNKPNQEEQELINKQNKELNEHLLDLTKRQFVLMQQSKMMQEMDLKRQSEILMKRQIELKVQEMILQNEQLSINKMLLDSKFHHNLVSPVLPVSPEADAVLNLTEPVPPVPPVMEGKPINSIIDDLIEEKVITDRDNLSFTLNNKILKVNGAIQPAELHAKLKERYIQGNAGNHVIYSKHGGSTSADVIINK